MPALPRSATPLSFFHEQTPTATQSDAALSCQDDKFGTGLHPRCLRCEYGALSLGDVGPWGAPWGCGLRVGVFRHATRPRRPGEKYRRRGRARLYWRSRCRGTAGWADVCVQAAERARGDGEAGPRRVRARSGVEMRNRSQGQTETSGRALAHAICIAHAFQVAPFGCATLVFRGRGRKPPAQQSQRHVQSRRREQEAKLAAPGQTGCACDARASCAGTGRIHRQQPFFAQSQEARRQDRQQQLGDCSRWLASARS